MHQSQWTNRHKGRSLVETWKDVFAIRRLPAPSLHAPILGNDDDILRECELALAALLPASDYAIRVMVANGWVVLLGEVRAGHERDHVTLTGTVHSRAVHRAALNAAWSSDGVKHVADRLTFV